MTEEILVFDREKMEGIPTTIVKGEQQMSKRLETYSFITFVSAPTGFEDSHEVSIRAESIRAVEELTIQPTPTCLIWVDGLHDQLSVVASKQEILEKMTNALNRRRQS